MEQELKTSTDWSWNNKWRIEKGFRLEQWESSTVGFRAGGKLDAESARRHPDLSLRQSLPAAADRWKRGGGRGGSVRAALEQWAASPS